jgi:hypothetical protein
METKRLTRRDFLRVSAVAAAGILAGCAGPLPTTQKEDPTQTLVIKESADSQVDEILTKAADIANILKEQAPFIQFDEQGKREDGLPILIPKRAPHFIRISSGGSLLPPAPSYDEELLVIDPMDITTAAMLYHIDDPSLLNAKAPELPSFIKQVLEERQQNFDSPSFKEFMDKVFSTTGEAENYLYKIYREFLSRQDDFVHVFPLDDCLFDSERWTTPYHYFRKVAFIPRNGRQGGVHNLALVMTPHQGFYPSIGSFGSFIARDPQEIAIILDKPKEWSKTKEGKGILHDLMFSRMDLVGADGPYHTTYNYVSVVLHDFFIDLALRQAGISSPEIMPTGGIVLYHKLVEFYSQDHDLKTAKKMAFKKLINWAIHPDKVTADLTPKLPKLWPDADLNDLDIVGKLVKADKAGGEDEQAIKEILSDLQAIFK